MPSGYGLKNLVELLLKNFNRLESLVAGAYGAIHAFLRHANPTVVYPCPIEPHTPLKLKIDSIFGVMFRHHKILLIILSMIKQPKSLELWIGGFETVISQLNFLQNTLKLGNSSIYFLEVRLQLDVSCL